MSLLGTVECNRCDACEKLNGARVRLARGGQSSCVDCVAARKCQTSSPLMDSKTSRPQFSDPTTEGAKNSESSPQDTFEIDVYQKQRISERLRVEKELFPECIQAPAKYFNKRKSLNASKRGKENRNTTYFPGEEISSAHDRTMNKSRNFVQEWLNKHPNTSLSPQPRSPFADLKINTHHKQATHSTPLKDKQKENAPKLPTRLSNRKRSKLNQTPSTITQISLGNYLKPLEKGKNKKGWSAKRLKQEFDDTSKNVNSKQQCDESGIVIDDDCFTIEDTQDQIVDKDKLALLEVEKANLKAITETMIVIGDTDESHVNEEASMSMKHDGKMSHVPFYKRGLLYENCPQCITSNALHDSILPLDNAPKKSNDVSITVENKSFITTISIVDCSSVNSGIKRSTAVQTEVEQPFIGFEQVTQRETVSLIAKIKKYIDTEDIPVSGEDVQGMDSQKTSCTDVAKKQDGSSKADENVVDDNVMSFGLSSEQEFGVLTALDGAGFQNKRKRGVRGVTPDSNNSSDKENCDPNRKKKRDAKKKKKNKS